MGSNRDDTQRIQGDFKRADLTYFAEEDVKQKEPGIRPAL